MPQKGLSMRQITEVLRLAAQGLSYRQIGQSLNLSPSTIQSYVKRAERGGVSWPLPEDLDGLGLEERLFTRSEEELRPGRPEPDWLEVHRERKRKHVTLQLLWLEYKAANPAGADRLGPLPAEPVEDEEECEEGRLVFRSHRARERAGSLVTRKRQQALAAHGKLACEVCGFNFAETYGEVGQGFAEVHHVVALSETGVTQTRLKDLAVLCSNCHRMAHRRRPWPSVADLAKLVSTRH